MFNMFYGKGHYNIENLFNIFAKMLYICIITLKYRNNRQIDPSLL